MESFADAEWPMGWYIIILELYSWLAMNSIAILNWCGTGSLGLPILFYVVAGVLEVLELVSDGLWVGGEIARRTVVVSIDRDWRGRMSVIFPALCVHSILLGTTIAQGAWRADRNLWHFKFFSPGRIDTSR